MSERRNEYVGFSLTTTLRRAIEGESEKTGLSMSRLVERVMIAHYQRRGVLPKPKVPAQEIRA